MNTNYSVEYIHEFNKAKHYINFFKQNSQSYDYKNDTLINHSIILYDLGLLSLHDKDYNSANKCFRNLLDINEFEAGYKGLLELYQELNNSDSIAKYAKLYSSANNTSFINKNSEVIVQMTAIYDYGRHKRIAEIKTQENILLKQRIYILILLALVVIALISKWLLHLRHIEKNKKEAITNSYFEALSAKNKIEEEIEKLREFMAERENAINKSLSQSEQKALEEISAKNNLLYEKEQELQQLQDYIVDLKSKYKVVDKIDTVKRLEAFKKTAAYKHIAQSKLFKDNITAKTNHRWNEFCHLYAQYFPIYYTQINNSSLLSPDEKKVSLLLVVDFSPIEIARIMNKSRSQISNNRASISKKLYNIDSAKELTDNLLKDFYKDK